MNLDAVNLDAVNLDAVNLDAVNLDGVSKSFGAVRAVDELSLTIPRGETVALLGPNGAGKTTTIGMLLGLLRPDAGTARVLGATPDDAVARGRIAAMLQEGGLMPDVKVAELVGFVRGLYPDPLPLGQVLETAGLSDLAGRLVNRLSGGQTQRLRLALALAGDPDVLVLDEPTAGMDVEARRAFWATMRAYAASGRTVLFATHYLEEADENADRIVVLARGRLVADGPATEIKATVGGRSVRFTLDGESSEGLDRLPGVTAVEIRGESVILRTTDADETVAALYAGRGKVRDIEVTGADLEDAFLSLTERPGAAPSGEHPRVPREPGVDGERDEAARRAPGESSATMNAKRPKRRAEHRAAARVTTDTGSGSRND